MTEKVSDTSEKASKPAPKKTTRKPTKKAAPKAVPTETDIPQADNPIAVDKDAEIAELKRRVLRLERTFNVSE